MVKKIAVAILVSSVYVKLAVAGVPVDVSSGGAFYVLPPVATNDCPPSLLNWLQGGKNFKKLHEGFSDAKAADGSMLSPDSHERSQSSDGTTISAVLKGTLTADGAKYHYKALLVRPCGETKKTQGQFIVESDASGKQFVRCNMPFEYMLSPTDAAGTQAALATKSSVIETK